MLRAIHACQPWNVIGNLRKGATYRLTASGHWKDARIETGPDGYERASLRLFEPFRRSPSSRWFALIGTFGRDGSTAFHLGSDAQFTAGLDCTLYGFANDWRIMYWNNSGALDVVLRELWPCRHSSSSTWRRAAGSVTADLEEIPAVQASYR